jgi:acyl-coenzyme A synthetase/AMP-(fatty) acid ligase
MRFHPRRHALEKPQDIAFRISTTGQTVTFAELEARANQAAHLFRRHGLKRGDHIVILMENRREFLEICFGADRSGLYYTTASTHLTNDEIQYIIRDCGAALCHRLGHHGGSRSSLGALADTHGCPMHDCWPDLTHEAFQNYTTLAVLAAGPANHR